MSKEKTVKITVTVMPQTVEGLKENARENFITVNEAAERLISRWKTDDPLAVIGYMLEQISKSCMHLAGKDDVDEVLYSVFEVLRKSLPENWMKDTAEQIAELFGERGTAMLIDLPGDGVKGGNGNGR